MSLSLNLSFIRCRNIVKSLISKRIIIEMTGMSAFGKSRLGNSDHLSN